MKEFDGTNYNTIHPETDTSMIVDFNTNNFIQKELFFTQQLNQSKTFSSQQIGLPTLVKQQYLFLTLELIFKAQTELTINNSWAIWVNGFGFFRGSVPSRSVMSFSVAPSSTEVFTIQEDISVSNLFLSIPTNSEKIYPEFVGTGTTAMYIGNDTLQLQCAYAMTTGNPPNPVSATFSQPVTFNIWGYK